MNMETRPRSSRLTALPSALALFLALAVGCSTTDQWSHSGGDRDHRLDLSQPRLFEDLTAEEILEQAPFWMSQAQVALAVGDSSAAEQGMMRAILALQEIFLDVPEPARPVLLDSLAAWSRTYEDSFGAISGDLVATSEGLSSLVTREDAAAGPDSLIETLALDTFEVVLDTTILIENILPGIPDTVTHKVENVITYFTQKQRGRQAMEVWLQRAEEMVPRIQPILRAHGMPEDLIYLAMIESGFRHDAHSWAAAVGPWQFISSTGKLFDLQIDWWYDERRDPEMATEAASRYLRQLYEHLGDWYLALAAYNCGEARVQREINRSSTRNFWDLTRLPRQTRDYIPTFLAARMIAREPEKYGFKAPVFRPIVPRDTVYVSEAVDMDALADALNLEHDQFKLLNPSIRRWCTPPGRANTPVYLPAGMSDGFAEALATVPPAKKTAWARHTVRSGEALSAIARQYGTSMQAIMDVRENHLTNPNRIRKGQVLLIPVGPESAAGYSGPADDPDSGDSRVYVVRRGDTLSQIAERNGVGLSRLMSWNGLSRYSTIRPGQKLVLYGGRSEPKSKVTATADRTDDTGRPVYVVRGGDTLTGIAARHGVALSEVLAWNGLTQRSVIHIGQKLIVGEGDGSGSSDPAPGGYAAADPAPNGGFSASQKYTVRRGDTLWDIAKNHSITVTDLRRANGLSGSSTIQPGQVLRVPAPSLRDSDGGAGSREVETVYLVRRGDTLWNIARQFDISVNDLKLWNNITDARGIKPGERLIIRRAGGGRNG